ncbi:MAG: endonuclease domain-containing protein [Clostridia bacterium]|nr:endonuclease domain-containing protein [Clostridia bacterium]
MSETARYLKSNSQKLRREMTEEEKKLWYDFLKNLPVKVHRQKVIGNYIVDFYCATNRIVIELDGSQHYEDEGIKKDMERDGFLRSLGYTVLRYSNADVNLRFDNVCKDILRYIEAIPHPSQP